MNKVYQLYLYSTNYSVENKREVYEGPMGVFSSLEEAENSLAKFCASEKILNKTTGAALSLRSSACRFACKETLCSGQVTDVFDRVLEYHADNSPETHAKFIELAK